MRAKQPLPEICLYKGALMFISRNCHAIISQPLPPAADGLAHLADAKRRRRRDLRGAST